MKSAIVEKGVVVNVIVGTREGAIECPDEVGPGWGYEDQEWVAPPVPEPEPEPEPASPVERLTAFLRENPDVAALLE